MMFASNVMMTMIYSQLDAIIKKEQNQLKPVYFVPLILTVDMIIILHYTY